MLPEVTPARRWVAEALGTALLLIAVVGSGIMGERLSGGNGAVALLANSLSTGAALAVLILNFGPISGAHFNPVVTVAQREIPWGRVPAYVAAQVIGALIGVAAANAMFELPVFSASRHERHGMAQILGEAVATFGLVAVIRGCARRPAVLPFAVAAWITGAYWFTSSTSFANPAVTLARSLTDTFTGIRPADVPGFIAAQAVGGAAAILLFRWLLPGPATVLFACVHNAGRSQMAAALFNELADPARARAISAGTEPGPRVHPEVLEAMRELGIDLAGAKPRKLTPGLASQARMLITMGCGEACPVLPALEKRDWPIEDPKGKTVERVREIREDVARRVRALVESKGWGPTASGRD